MSFYVPRDNEDFAAPKAEGAEGEQAEDGEAAAAAAVDPPAKVLFDMVSQFTDAGGRRQSVVVGGGGGWGHPQTGWALRIAMPRLHAVLGVTCTSSRMLG